MFCTNCGNEINDKAVVCVGCGVPVKHESAIYEAVRDGKLGMVKSLIDKGTDVNAKDNDGNTLLHHAAAVENSNTEMIRFLIKLSSKVNSKKLSSDLFSWPTYFLSHADLDVTNKDGKTPLNIAGTEENKQILREAGWDKNAREWGMFGGVFVIAGIWVMMTMAEPSITMKQVGKVAFVSLMMSFFFGCPAGAKLASIGCLTGVRLTRSGVGAFWGAMSGIIGGAFGLTMSVDVTRSVLLPRQLPEVIGGSIFLVSLVLCLYAGAKIGGFAAGWIIRMSGRVIGGFLMSLILGAMLWYCCCCPRVGVNTSVEKTDNTTTVEQQLFDAAKEGNLDVVKHLIEKGVDVNAKMNNGRTPLSYAASGKFDYLRSLFKEGADVNTKGNDGETILRSAANYSNLETVKYLIEKGVDINAKDGYGKTPFDYAETDEIRKILRDAGGKSGKDLE